MKVLTYLFTSILLAGCTHFGLDSVADLSAENCYAYRYGDKLRRINFVQAFDWCQRSARQGNANSQALLGELYYLGLGGEQDIEQAGQWYLKAAKQGHAHGQYMVYIILAENKEAIQQNKSAHYWLKQAQQSQYKLAQGESLTLNSK